MISGAALRIGTRAFRERSGKCLPRHPSRRRFAPPRDEGGWVHKDLILRSEQVERLEGCCVRSCKLKNPAGKLALSNDLSHPADHNHPAKTDLKT